MFKRKPPVEAPRVRQRVTQSTPQNAVFSYHANRATSNDPRGRQTVPDEKPRRRRTMPKWLRPQNILSAIMVLIVFLLLVGLSSTPKIVITGDESGRPFLQDPATYQRASRKLLGSSPLNGNKLTVNTSAVAESLKKSYPEIRAVSVSLPVFGRQPTVYIQPATPQMLIRTQHGQFVLDSTGRALTQVAVTTKLPEGDAALPVVDDQSGLTVRAGQIALPSKSVAFITGVAGQLKAHNIGVTSWTLPARTSQLDVKIAGESYLVEFNLQGDPKEQAGTFVATKNRLAAQQTLPGEYIDVRVSGRAYYR